MKKPLLSVMLCGVFAAAAYAAVYTTLDYENARETNTLATVRAEIIAATNSVVTTETDPVWTAEKSGYLQKAEDTARNISIGSSGDRWYLSNGMNFHIKSDMAYPETVFYWPGYGSTSELARIADVIAATNNIVTTETDPVWTADKHLYATTNGVISTIGVIDPTIAGGSTSWFGGEGVVITLPSLSMSLATSASGGPALEYAFNPGSVVSTDPDHHTIVPPTVITYPIDISDSTKVDVSTYNAAMAKKRDMTNLVYATAIAGNPEGSSHWFEVTDADGVTYTTEWNSEYSEWGIENHGYIVAADGGYGIYWEDVSATFTLADGVARVTAGEELTVRGFTGYSYDHLALDSAVAEEAGTITSNIVDQAYIREKLGVYLYVGEDGGVYVHTGE